MNPPADFGRLAHLYRWMEYLSFGPYLTKCRELRLEELTAEARTIVYGDGDGRFLSTMLKRRPAMQVISIEASEAMLREASRRLPSNTHARLICADALCLDAAALPMAPFDLVVSHFFLDCFRDDEIATLLVRVNAATRAGTEWIISDFARPRGAVRGSVGAAIIAALYAAFGLITGLRTRRLPDYSSALRQAGWRLEDEQTLLGGLLTSQRWRRGPENHELDS